LIDLVKVTVMDGINVGAGVLLVLAGLTGIIYGLGINVTGMMARGATDYSFITAYVAEWIFVLIAGLLMIVSGVRRK
jgi:hypothetical protein